MSRRSRARVDRSGPLDVTHVIWRLSQSGGVQTVVRMLIGASDPGAVRFTLVTARPVNAEDDLESLPVTHVPLDHARSGLRPQDRVRLMLAVARTLRRRRPDVVQFHSGTVWLGFLAPLFARGHRFLVEVHDAPGSGRHGKVTDWVEGLWCRFTRAHVVCHSTSVAEAITTQWKVAPSRLHLLPLAVDLDRFAVARFPDARAVRRRDLGLADDAVVLLVVGRFVTSKRFDRAIAALAGLDERVVLVAIGDGPERQALADAAAAAGVTSRVVFTGVLVGDELAAAYAMADVLVSTSAYEGFGLTLVEGMAAGLPAVATAVGGVTDIVVEGETGLLVPVDDAEALLAALRTVTADPALRSRFGAAGRTRAEQRFSAAALGAGFTELYRKVAGRA